MPALSQHADLAPITFPSSDESQTRPDQTLSPSRSQSPSQSLDEWQDRNQYAADAYVIQSTVNMTNGLWSPTQPFISQWNESALYLLRHNHQQIESELEVLLVDSDRLIDDLSQLVGNELPDVQIIAAPDSTLLPGAGRLAAMPLQVLPGQGLPGFIPPSRPFASIAAILVSVLIATVALAGLAAGSMRLAARRAHL